MYVYAQISICVRANGAYERCAAREYAKRVCPKMYAIVFFCFLIFFCVRATE